MFKLVTSVSMKNGGRLRLIIIIHIHSPCSINHPYYPAILPRKEDHQLGSTVESTVSSMLYCTFSPKVARTEMYPKRIQIAIYITH